MADEGRRHRNQSSASKPASDDAVLDSDAQLIAGVLLCRFESLATIYEQHSADVHGLARRLCGSDADEVVRGVFLTFWRAPDEYDADGGTLAEYLATLTFAAAVDHLRRTSISHDAGPRDASQRRDLAERVGRAAWDALGELPPALRDAIATAHLSGHSYSEIAERLAQVDIDPIRTPRTGLGEIHRAITRRAPFGTERRRSDRRSFGSGQSADVAVDPT